jgi:hypothetical protein
MSDNVKVMQLRALPGLRLWLRFSNGTEGVRDFVDIVAETGPMIEPLRDTVMFEKVFLSMGVPTWPNGLQLDPTNLHMELADRRALTRPVAAE